MNGDDSPKEKKEKKKKVRPSAQSGWSCLFQTINRQHLRSMP